MRLVPVSVDSIRINQPLPFSLMDKNGVLLAKKSFVILSRADLDTMARRSGGLCVDVTESEAHHRAYVGRLHELVRGEKPLGEIADTTISADLVTERTASEPEFGDWLDLQAQTNALVRDSNASAFMDRLERIHRQLSRYAQRSPDGALFALIQLSATEVHMYSATHAMLVSVICGLAARDVLNWPEPELSLLFKAALTMNVGMTDLQDRLALQIDAPSASQRVQIDTHAARSAKLLEGMGVHDTDWLDAVREHHTQAPGALASRSVAQRVARLIQRADMFASRLAPRAARAPISPVAAMQACYFDENRQIDEAGAALIKAVGIYQPGAFVRLATDEIAVVIKRGLNTTTPRVAVLINRSGLPTSEPIQRDTTVREYRIVASVPHRDVKLQVNLERLLPLTVTNASDRPW